mmetsp:Transcript_22264/g.56235  ORF Transcript_22264/g.56235 Transcript_22264/m.56235 type:complete len:120 (+) Transcript_22264:623-982(+)
MNIAKLKLAANFFLLPYVLTSSTSSAKSITSMDDLNFHFFLDLFPPSSTAAPLVPRVVSARHLLQSRVYLYVDFFVVYVDAASASASVPAENHVPAPPCACAAPPHVYAPRAAGVAPTW